MASIQAFILAAGKSSRFNTSASKLSHSVCGQEMIMYPVKLLHELGIDTTLIVGYQKEKIAEIVKKYGYLVKYVEQKEQKGTGHAVLCTQNEWFADSILILNGDVPLLPKETLTKLISKHTNSDAIISLVTTTNANPELTGYGRVIQKNKSISIVEHRDFTGDPLTEQVFNVGIYLIKRSFLEKTLANLPAHSSGEIFITDLVKKASDENLTVELIDSPFHLSMGVNTLSELSIAEMIKGSEIIEGWRKKGVRIAQSALIDINVTIEPDSIIGAHVQLRNATQLAKNVFVDAFSVLDNAVIHENVTIHPHSIISHSEVHASSQVGPFSHVHRQSVLGTESAIGNFVEVSKSSIGPKSKAKHLAYLGNAHIGTKVNIGAGTITCNYNGVSKHITTIEDNAFIGSNSALLAPVTIGAGAIIAAGSTITNDVPSNALAIARSTQTTKENYAPQVREKLQQREVSKNSNNSSPEENS